MPSADGFLSLRLPGLPPKVNYEELGYRTGTVVLPGLDMPLSLRGNVYFRHDGIVPNARAHCREVFEEAERPDKTDELLDQEYGSSAGKVLVGACVVLEDQMSRTSPLGLCTFIRDAGSPQGNTLHLAHESTHALIKAGRGDLLVDYIRDAGFSLNPFEAFDDEEWHCDTGGLVAVARKYGPPDRSLDRIFPEGSRYHTWDPEIRARRAEIHKALQRSRL